MGEKSKKKRKLKILEKRGEESKAIAGPKWVHGLSPSNKPSKLMKRHHIKKSLKKAGIEVPKEIENKSLKRVLERASEDEIERYNKELQERYIADTLEVNQDITKKELKEKLDVSEETIENAVERFRESHKKGEIHDARYKAPLSSEQVEKRLEKGKFKERKEEKE